MHTMQEDTSTFSRVPHNSAVSWHRTITISRSKEGAKQQQIVSTFSQEFIQIIHKQCILIWYWLCLRWC